jgi:2-amino-4-hydroxy-6-hydroxymethyldihydropteridine diphosphokinase
MKIQSQTMKMENYFEKKRVDKECLNRVVYISAGSNMGDREKNIGYSFKFLKESFSFFQTASLYETEPLYNTAQPNFLNTVFKGVLKNKNSADNILSLLLSIENIMGRKRDINNLKGERNIDLDLLLFGNNIINKENLQIPHPGIKERLFVLFPLVELESGLIDPVTKQKYSEIAKQLKQGIYLYKSCRYIERYI